MELVGAIKTYDWGKLGIQSKVAQLARLNSSDFSLEETVPYAELWMGDHVSGPSTVKSTKESLRSRSGEPLPFLFKVLSIRKALSIQVHPNKTEAQRLHTEFPDVYKDANHKPELAIALTPFQALCGFRPICEVAAFLEEFAYLKQLIGYENAADLNSEKQLQICFEKLMKSDQNDVASCIDAIQNDFKGDKSSHRMASLFCVLNKDFPHDVGVLCLFFLNYLNLQEGEAIYLSANTPHAYLDGDIIECMACSDNVVRAGLTPKFKDIDTLIKMLDYTAEPATKKIFMPRTVALREYTLLFVPPVEDFAVIKYEVPSHVTEYTLEIPKNASILIVLSGKATGKFIDDNELVISSGSIIYIPKSANKSVILNIEPSECFLAYQATSNEFLP